MEYPFFSGPILLEPIGTGVRALNFYYRDVRPAIRARRLARRDDIISHLLDENYSDRAIMIECMTYAAAGMVTTREFIVMAAWHLLERDALRARFLAGTDEQQLSILEEILRLEPVASMLSRRAVEEIPNSASGSMPPGSNPEPPHSSQLTSTFRTYGPNPSGGSPPAVLPAGLAAGTGKSSDAEASMS